MAPIVDALCQPGLDVQMLAWQGPVTFCRLQATCAALQVLEAPLEAWCFAYGRSMDAEQAEIAAKDLLRAATPHPPPLLALGRGRWEPLLDQLFVLTSAGRPRACCGEPMANLLDIAVQRLLRPVIPLLLVRGYSLELLDAYSLESFVQEDDAEAVAAYLEAGISPDIRANAGRSVLMVAVAVKAGKVASVLLAHNADVHQRSGFGQWTALMWAAHAAWPEGCRILLDAGACAEDRNAQQLTAQDIARRCSSGDESMQQMRAMVIDMLQEHA